MKLNRTWTRRLGHSQSIITTFGRPAVLGLAALAGLNVLWQWLFAAPVDVIDPARTVVNKSAVVSAFAQDFVSTWLTATAPDPSDPKSGAKALAQFVTLNSTQVRLPSTPAVVITAPTVVAVTFAGSARDTEIYSVAVGVNERPYESASPRRSLYRVAVLWSKYGPRAASLPARIGGPGPGADLPLSYPTTLGASDAVYGVVSGFLTAYLTAAGGVERFVTTDSLLVGLGAVYQNVTVTELAATGTPPTTPVEGQMVRVLARVDAVTAQYAPTQLVYPLTLRGVGGRWAVAGIDQAPAVSTDDDLMPAMAGQGGPR